MPTRLRVFIVGVTPEDVARLAERLGGDAGHKVVGSALLSDVQRGVSPIPADVDAVMLTPRALQRGVASRSGLMPTSDTVEVRMIESLTAREREVLERVADGVPNREIAASLGISEHTVKFHLSSIFGKLGATSRTEAVRRGLRLGLIEI